MICWNRRERREPQNPRGRGSADMRDRYTTGDLSRDDWVNVNRHPIIGG